ncbi:hypothetical protein [Nocardioides ferulae]|uniref:hypothetical protein n=1 Tax=Nocardioides ferulae TaxID=2340821 RepID=UPI000EB5D179|nr:hypothetical protein [Nocardioides ferulae]
MARIILTEPVTEQDSLDPAGDPWPYAVQRGTTTILSDSLTEILGALMPEYDEIPRTPAGDDQALVFRYQAAVSAANQVQSYWSGRMASEGEFVPVETDDDTLHTLLNDRLYPVEDVDRWTHPVPLILVSIDYAPYTERTPPRGNVKWIDPHDELLFLHGLAGLGLIAFMVHGDETENAA